MSFFTKVRQPLINRDFFTSMENIHREMNDFFEKQDLSQTMQESWDRNQFIPPVDIIESDNGYKIEMDIPGMKAQDLNIELIENMLIVQGKKKVELKETESKGVLRTERSYGQFYRTLPFGHRINPEKVRAKMKNGVLKIQLEKIIGEIQNTRKITITE